MSDIVWAKPKTRGRRPKGIDLVITTKRVKGEFYFLFSFKGEVLGIANADHTYCIGFDYENGKVYVTPDENGYTLAYPHKKTSRQRIRIPFKSFGIGSAMMVGSYEYSCTHDNRIVFKRRENNG